MPVIGWGAWIVMVAAPPLGNQEYQEHQPDEERRRGVSGEVEAPDAGVQRLLVVERGQYPERNAHHQGHDNREERYLEGVRESLLDDGYHGREAARGRDAQVTLQEADDVVVELRVDGRVEVVLGHVELHEVRVEGRGLAQPGVDGVAEAVRYYKCYN
jgi:multidrug efflux pump subunit AcrA (membrane-fusion protein)